MEIYLFINKTQMTDCNETKLYGALVRELFSARYRPPDWFTCTRLPDPKRLGLMSTFLQFSTASAEKVTVA